MMDELFYFWWEYTDCCLYIPFPNFAAWILRWPLSHGPPYYMLCGASIIDYFCCCARWILYILLLVFWRRRWYKKCGHVFLVILSTLIQVRQIQDSMLRLVFICVVIFCGVLWTTKVRWSVRGCDVLSRSIDVFRCNDCWEFSMLLSTSRYFFAASPSTFKQTMPVAVVEPVFAGDPSWLRSFDGWWVCVWGDFFFTRG